MRVVVQWLPETGTVFVVVVFEGDWRLNYRLKRLPPHMESEFYFRKYETVLGSAELPR